MLGKKSPFKIVIDENAEQSTKKIQKKFLKLQKESEEMEIEIDKAQHVEEKVLQCSVTY